MGDEWGYNVFSTNPTPPTTLILAFLFAFFRSSKIDMFLNSSMICVVGAQPEINIKMTKTKQRKNKEVTPQ